MFQQVQCPVCHETFAQEPLHCYTVQQAADHFCSAARNADRNARLQGSIRRLFGGESATVHHCPACGFGFGWPFVGGDELYYAILHEQAGYTKWRWEYGLTQQILKDIPPGKIIDIGAGDGAFLKSFDKSWQLFATEGSQTTRDMLRTVNIQCFADTKDAIQQAAGTFDAITMFQVLEHIAEFDQMLADCRQILRPGGLLVVSVPDGDAVRDQEQLTGCADMTPNHINKWTPKSLGLAMQRNGLEPQTPVMEPRSLQSYLSRAGLKVLGRMTTRPKSLAAKANGFQKRIVRKGALAALLGVELLRSLPQFPRMSRGLSFVIVGRKT